MAESTVATGVHGDGEGAALPSPLTVSVTAGESGPVIMLSGEADLTSAGQLSALTHSEPDPASEAWLPGRALNLDDLDDLGVRAVSFSCG